MEKLQLAVEDIFKPEGEIIRRFTQAETLELTKQKEALTHVFEGIVPIAHAVDVSLEGTVRAELQKQLTSLENLEKRILKAAKNKEEVKIQQLQKLKAELFPEGQAQERHDNYFQFYMQLGNECLDLLFQNFNPLKNQLTVLVQEDE